MKNIFFGDHDLDGRLRGENPFFPVDELTAAQQKLVEETDYIFATDDLFGRHGFVKQSSKVFARFEREVETPNGTLFPPREIQSFYIPHLHIDEVTTRTWQELKEWQRWYSTQQNVWYVPLDKEVQQTLLYSWKGTQLPNGKIVPVLAVGLTKKPTIKNCNGWVRSESSEMWNNQKIHDELDQVQLLAQDLEEFPRADFYEALLNLDDIKIRPSREKDCYSMAYALEKEKEIVVRPTALKELLKLGDFADRGFARLLVHEMYHHVEWALEDRVSYILKGHTRFNIQDGASFSEFANRLTCPTINYAQWNGRDLNFPCEYYDQQFAELLTALTIARYPEIEGTLALQINYMREIAENQGQLFKSQYINRPRVV